jgi:hypothetical protein
MIRYRLKPNLIALWLLKDWPYPLETLPDSFRIALDDNETYLCDILERHIGQDEYGNEIDMAKLRVYVNPLNGKEKIGWTRTSFVELYFFEQDPFDGRYNLKDDCWLTLNSE